MVVHGCLSDKIQNTQPIAQIQGPCLCCNKLSLTYWLKQRYLLFHSSVGFKLNCDKIKVLPGHFLWRPYRKMASLLLSTSCGHLQVLRARSEGFQSSSLTLLHSNIFSMSTCPGFLYLSHASFQIPVQLQLPSLLSHLT